MRQFRLVLVAAALAVSACVPLGSPDSPNPSAIADKTTIDERSMLGLETLYLSANQLASTALDLGRIKTDADRATVKEADRKAYAALLAARHAYRAGNSTSFDKASAELVGMAEEIRNLTRKP